MQPLPHRTWQGDAEIVYESDKGYVQWLVSLAAICGINITNGSEVWPRRDNGDIDICITYNYGAAKYTIWTERNGDYLNRDVLWLLNMQLGHVNYTFQCAAEDYTVYYINTEEKEELEKEGISFMQGYPVLFLVYNALMCLSSNNDFAYQLIQSLNENILSFKEQADEDIIKAAQATMQTLLTKVDWTVIADKGIETENLYLFLQR